MKTPSLLKYDTGMVYYRIVRALKMEETLNSEHFIKMLHGFVALRSHKWKPSVSCISKIARNFAHFSTLDYAMVNSNSYFIASS